MLRQSSKLVPLSFSSWAVSKSSIEIPSGGGPYRVGKSVATGLVERDSANCTLTRPRPSSRITNSSALGARFPLHPKRILVVVLAPASPSPQTSCQRPSTRSLPDDNINVTDGPASPMPRQMCPLPSPVSAVPWHLSASDRGPRLAPASASPGFGLVAAP